MSDVGMRLDTGLCTGCGACVRACGSGAIALKDGVAVIEAAACTLCGLCAGACPVHAIEQKKAAAQAEAASGHRGVWIFAEAAEGSPLPVALELLSHGRQLAQSLNAPLAAVWIGPGPDACRTLADHGAHVVYHCADPRAAQPDEEIYCAILSALAEREKPEIILFGATAFGRSLAPRLAARLQTGLTADCTGLAIDATSGLLRQTRPAFGGNLMATIVCPNHRPQLATVRPGVLPMAPSTRGSSFKTVPVCPDRPLSSRLELLGCEAESHVNALASAPVVLSVGRGIGNEKNLHMAIELAGRLGAELGATRPLIESGWLPYAHQIGQTGLSIAPRLLIAMGVSGAIQHLAGISRAETIVAVNSDPDAPIFKVADYTVLADCRDVLQALLTKTARQ